MSPADTARKELQAVVKELEGTARKELQAVVEELEGLQGRLLEIRRVLPSPPSEDEFSNPDASTEMKRVVECVLQDCIGPAIRDLLAAVEYRPGGVAEP